MTSAPSSDPGRAFAGAPPHEHGLTNAIVGVFLRSNLSVVLILLAAAVGGAALWVTPREEDPQIVVPLADVHVSFPGHSAAEVEQLVATPLEKLLYEIDGVEYVYSMSQADAAIITVRFYVGQDRERSLVKLYKRIDEHIDTVPPGVTGWVVKPVEIDDVPIVTLALRASDAAARPPSDDGAAPAPDARPDEYVLRRVAEELVARLAVVPDVSRAYVIGGQPRVVTVHLDADRMQAYGVDPPAVERALRAANVTRTAGEFTREDQSTRVEVGRAFASPQELRDLVVSVTGGAGSSAARGAGGDGAPRPVFLKDVATITDGPAEAESYVRHGWGPAVWSLAHVPGTPGTFVGGGVPGPSGRAAEEALIAGAAALERGVDWHQFAPSRPAVTIAVAKKKGTNAVWVAENVLRAAEELRREVVPDDVELVVTRNYGQTADHKVNELVEALAVAVLIVVALLTLGLGWREALVVAVAVPVVFGLTLAVNYLFGYTINRVTLFALILSLGLLVDDPIVDVENIARHFALRRRATRQIVLEAVAEIRPPLITATLAVIVSFLPMFFITGMMGPYMRPMALNVPVTMLMSMLVAFTITPWLAYHMLRRSHGATEPRSDEGEPTEGPADDLAALKRSRLYRLFYPLMAPLLRSRRNAWAFIAIMALLTVAAAMLAATRSVPLKMLPFDNKNELLLVIDTPEGTTLERTDAVVRDLEAYIAAVPEVTDFTSYVGVASPMDFNGLVRHYYLRRGPNVAEIRLNLIGKKSRRMQSHGLALRMRDDLTAVARRHDASLKIVEVPPGPPVISSIVAEVRGRPDHSYADLIAAAQTVRARLEREPGVVDVDDSTVAEQRKLVFVTDKEKAALAGVSVEQIAETVRIALGGSTAGTVHVSAERNPLRIELRLPRAVRSSAADLARLNVVATEPRRHEATKGNAGILPAREPTLVPLAELGRWEEQTVDQPIYHKNLERVVYVFAESAGRPPAECVVDIQADRLDRLQPVTGVTEALVAPVPPDPLTLNGLAGFDAAGAGYVSRQPARALRWRTYLWNGGRTFWWVPDGIGVAFAGEGEWKITLDVFRDLGLAFAAALVGIYVLLVAQTGSFMIPVVVMLAIPLTILGIMPGFWLLNAVAGGQVGPYADPVFFTATGMIGMIALAGIVTRDSIILVDFIHLSLRRGRSLFDAILESRVVRLRPILLTAAAAMLGAAPIVIDPIFSGLAWSLIFGLFASTVFTLFVIPVAYWLLYERKPGHGLVADA